MRKEFPRVTFALFSYNQEQYVREAMEAALAQDYPNLEIIVSDDCSSDGTFNLIEQIAEAYKGPHSLIIRRTEENRGFLIHVADVARMARGKLIVLAAGDDISKANRATVLHREWEDTGAWGLCSRHDCIDAAGRLLETGVQAPVLMTHGFDSYFQPGGDKVRVVHGCTSAYDARLFDYLKLAADDYILSEDGALSVLLNLLGKTIVHLDESLVLYRQSEKSLTNNAGRRPLSCSEIARDEANILRFAGAQANRCRLFLRMDEELAGVKVRSVSKRGVQAELRVQENKRDWYLMSGSSRVKCVLQNTVPRKWAVPRILGKGPFFFMKWIVGRLH